MNYQTGFVAQSQYLSIHAIRRVMTPSSTATNNMLTSSPESNHSSDYLTNTVMFMPFSPSTSSSSSSLAATATHGWKPRKPRGSISTTTSHQLLPTINIPPNTNTLASYPASAPPASSHLNNNEQSTIEEQDDEDDELALWNASYNDESNMMNMGPRSAPMQIPKPLQPNFNYDDDDDDVIFHDNNDVDFYQNSMYASSVPRAPPSIFHQVIADKRKKYMTAEERKLGKERSDFVSQLFVSPDPNMPKSDEIVPGKPPSEIEKEKQLRYLEEKFYYKSS